MSGHARTAAIATGAILGVGLLAGAVAVSLEEAGPADRPALDGPSGEDGPGAPSVRPADPDARGPEDVAAPSGAPVQLSLGDSWGSGVGAPPGQGYVDVLHGDLRQQLDCPSASSLGSEGGCDPLELVNLSVSGATTPALIAEQLPAAIALLEGTDGDTRHVELVTVHIGGNDVVGPILEACLGGADQTCLAAVDREFAQYREDLDEALAALRDAAGPDRPIVIGTYDNSLPTCDIGRRPAAEVVGPMLLEGWDAMPEGPVEHGLNDIIREVAVEHDVLVADVSGRLSRADWVGGADCLHPDMSGHAVVAEAFVEALDVS